MAHIADVFKACDVSQELNNDLAAIPIISGDFVFQPVFPRKNTEGSDLHNLQKCTTLGIPLFIAGVIEKTSDGSAPIIHKSGIL